METRSHATRLTKDMGYTKNHQKEATKLYQKRFHLAVTAAR